jgi:hypothetical protein
VERSLTRRRRAGTRSLPGGEGQAGVEPGGEEQARSKPHFSSKQKKFNIKTLAAKLQPTGGYFCITYFTASA